MKFRSPEHNDLEELAEKVAQQIDDLLIAECELEISFSQKTNEIGTGMTSLIKLRYLPDRAIRDICEALKEAGWKVEYFPEDYETYGWIRIKPSGGD